MQGNLPRETQLIGRGTEICRRVRSPKTDLSTMFPLLLPLVNLVNS